MIKTREKIDGLLNVRVVEFLKCGVHAVVHVSHKDADAARLVALNSWNRILDVLKSKLVDDLTCHLVTLSCCILTMPQMSCNDVEDSIVQGEVVCDASLVTNHLAHCSLGDLRCVHV